MLSAMRRRAGPTIVSNMAGIDPIAVHPVEGVEPSGAPHGFDVWTAKRAGCR